MTDHTPGPWTAKWSKYQDGMFIVQAGMPSNRVMARFDGDGDGPDEREIADAKLISAAPDLLEAIKLLLSSSHDYQTGIAEAEAAIAKAEGRDHG